MNRDAWTARNELFAKLWNEGERFNVIAETVEMNRRAISRHAQRLGLPARGREGEWTQGEQDLALKLRLEGQSMSQIAVSMGRTKGMVAGIFSRMRSAGVEAAFLSPIRIAVDAGKSRNARRPPKPGQQNRPALVHGKGVSGLTGEAARLKRAECRETGLAYIAAAANTVVESPNARPFLERRMLTECAWPIGEGLTMLSCCNPIDRRSYCKGHADIAFRATTPAFDYASGRSASSLTRHDRTSPSKAEDGDPEPLWATAA